MIQSHWLGTYIFIYMAWYINDTYILEGNDQYELLSYYALVFEISSNIAVVYSFW